MHTRGIGISMAITVALVALLAPVFWLVATSSGTQLLVRQLNGQLPSLTIGHVEGTLATGLRLNQIEYTDASFAVQVANATFRIRPAALFFGVVHLEALHLDGVGLTLPDTTERPSKDTEPPLASLPDAALPVKVLIDEIRLTKARIHQRAQTYAISSLTLRLEAQNELKLQELAIEWPEQASLPPFRARLAGELMLNTPHRLQLEGKWNTDLPETGKLEGKLTISGTPDSLRIQHHLSPLALQIDATLKDLPGALSWSANLSLPKVQWPLQDNPPQIALTGTSVIASGDLKTIQARLGTDLLEGHVEVNTRLQLDPALSGTMTMTIDGLRPAPYVPDWPQHLRVSQSLRAHFDAGQLTIEALDVTLPPSEAALKTTGTVALNPTGQHDLHLAWTQLQWPLEGSPLARLPAGSATFTGSVNDYLLQFDTKVIANHAPPVQLQGKGQGNSEEFRTLELLAHTLGGTLKLAGKAGWKPAVDWDLVLEADQIQPATHWPDLPGELSAVLATTGTLDDALTADVRLKQLTGTLRNYPVHATAAVQWQGKTLHIQSLTANSGTTRLQAEGTYGRTIDLNASLTSPDLSTLLPQAAGSLDASARISGSPDAPRITVNTHGQTLSLDQWALKALDGQFHLDTTTEALRLDVHMDQLMQNAQPRLRSLDLTSTGKLSEHQIRLSLDTPQGTLVTRLAGGYHDSEKRWKGGIDQFELASDQFGHWMTTETASLDVSADQATLDNFCLSEPDWQSQWCARVDRQGDKTETSGYLKHLPLATLASPWLPEHVSLTGLPLDSEWHILLNPPDHLTGTLKAVVDEGVATTQMEGKTHHFPLRQTTLDVGLSPTGITAGGQSHLLGHSQLTYQLELPEFRPLAPTDNPSLKASASVSVEDLALLASLVPAIERAAGKIHGEFHASGSLKQPRLQVDVTMTQGALDIPMAGLQLKDMQVALQADETGKATASARVQSGDGWLALNGRGDLKDLAHWSAQAELTGQRLLAINTPDITASLSPDLKLAASPAGATIHGDLVIPAANITPNVVIGDTQGGGSAVKPSPDVIVVRETQQARVSTPQKQRGYPVAGDVRIRLGEEVNLSVIGFRSRLGGDVLVHLDPERPLPTADGEIQILEGTFRSYGQDLQIDKGRILFLGGPIDNPGLDIKAYREIHQPGAAYLAAGAVSKAGVHIQGRAQSPRIKLFSEPMMDDKNILSYIVTGSGLGGDVRKSLSIGTYLQPNLYISVGYDLFENEKTFNMRYELSDKLGLEGIAGDRESGVDFSYRLTR